MAIFFDLDGTLIDAKQRVYTLFCAILQKEVLSYDAYWAHKRNQVSHATLLKNFCHFTESQIAAFEQTFLGKIETWEYLALDTPFEATEKILLDLSKNHDLYVVTARQSAENTLKQLNQWSWSGLFKQVFITEHKQEKNQLIRAYCPQLNQQDILVGDTGMDIQTAKKLNIISVAVLSGFRNQQALEKYAPDYIIEDIGDIGTILYK